MKPCELIAATSAIACCLVANKTTDEVAQMSAFFLLLGQTLDSLVTFEETCAPKENGRSEDDVLIS